MSRHLHRSAMCFLGCLGCNINAYTSTQSFCFDIAFKRFCFQYPFDHIVMWSHRYAVCSSTNRDLRGGSCRGATCVAKESAMRLSLHRRKKRCLTNPSHKCHNDLSSFFFHAILHPIRKLFSLCLHVSSISQFLS